MDFVIKRDAIIVTSWAEGIIVIDILSLYFFNFVMFLPITSGSKAPYIIFVGVFRCFSTSNVSCSKIDNFSDSTNGSKSSSAPQHCRTPVIAARRHRP